MPKDAIGQITAAEEQATVLCRVATERAAEMRAEMQRQASAHLAQVEQSVTEEQKELTAQCAARLEALSQKKRTEAQQQAEAMTELARERMADAVNMIVWGIVENVSK